jgi:hypothetical protein
MIAGALAVAAVMAATPPAAESAPPETRIIEVTASVRGADRTPEQARREALQRAREEAVADAVGFRVAAQQLRLRSEHDGELRDSFSSLVETTTEGRIVRDQVAYTTRLDGDIPVYDAKLRAEVALEDGVRDPGFTLGLATVPSTRTYRDGEAVVLEVTASKHCYLTLFQLDADGALEVLLPNRFLAQSEIAAGETIRIPRKSAGFEIHARLGSGSERERQQVLAIATLDPVGFDLGASEGDELSGEGRTDGLTALNRWLLQIPVVRRAEALWDFEIAR